MKESLKCMEDTNIPVSVVLPVYNGREHIGECIESVLSQTFRDFEFIIMDDGSEDGTADIVRTFHDARIRLMEREHGYIDTINALLAAARGKYVARIDADDLMLPGRLEKQFGFMEEHPDIDICGGGIRFTGGMSGDFVRAGEVTLKDLVWRNPIIHPTAFVRRESIAGLRYDEDYIYAEDYRLWACALRDGLKAYNLPDIIVQYRASHSQVSGQHREEQKGNAERVREEVRAWLGEGCTIPKLTAVIPFLNEGDEVRTTVRGIRDTAGDAVDIIAINDGSDDGYDYLADLRDLNVRYFANATRRGVAGSRDWGVTMCDTPYFILLDAHMRFYKEGWQDILTDLLTENDRRLLCCQTKFLGKDDNGVEYHRVKCLPTYGARLRFDLDGMWPNTDWKYGEERPGEATERIPAVLGAGYAASVRYWKRLKGLAGLRYYGSDEAYLSLKVWMEGGECVLVKDIVFGHIYREKSPFRRWHEEEVYNRLMIACTLFPDDYRHMTHAMAASTDKEVYGRALGILDANRELLDGLKEYYRSITAVPFHDVVRMHGERHRIYDEVAAMNAGRADEYLEWLHGNIPAGCGLYNGKAAVLLFLCMYTRFTRTDRAAGLIGQTIKDIYTAVRHGATGWNFGCGAAGIGWTLLYLHFFGYITGVPDELTGAIDTVVSQVAVGRVTDMSLGTGTAGILAYLSLRKCMPDYREDMFDIPELRKAAHRILETSYNVSECYFALSFLDGGFAHGKGLGICDEWLAASMTFQEGGWDTSITGSIGTFIKSFDYITKNSGHETYNQQHHPVQGVRGHQPLRGGLREEGRKGDAAHAQP